MGQAGERADCSTGVVGTRRWAAELPPRVCYQVTATSWVRSCAGPACVRRQLCARRRCSLWGYRGDRHSVPAPGSWHSGGKTSFPSDVRLHVARADPVPGPVARTVRASSHLTSSFAPGLIIFIPFNRSHSPTLRTSPDPAIIASQKGVS